MASMTASTLMRRQAAQIVVIDPAFVPTQPIGMSSKRMYVMGFLLALGFGLGLAMMCALLDDRVYDHVDVDRLELAPVLIEVTTRSMRGRKAAA
jgi:capsular polysaccharide biosynthesis protein